MNDLHGAWHAYLFLAVAVLLAAAAQILKKHGMTAFGKEEPALAVAILQPLVLLGLLCQIGMAGLWLLVLAQLEVSVAYPALSTGFVLVALWGHFRLGEAITPRRWLGIALIVAGVSLVAVGGQS